jgi:hypothetical protein
MKITTTENIAQVPSAAISPSAPVAGITKMTAAPVKVLIVSSAEASLTAEEITDLDACEKFIRTNMVAFLKVGQMLTRIRGRRLYRQDCKTFEEYCLKKWQLGKAVAYRLIAESEVNGRLSPIGDQLPRPANEAQYRELIGLNQDQTVKAWTNAVASAGEKPVTAVLVRRAASEFKTAKNRHKKSSHRHSGIKPKDGGKNGESAGESADHVVARLIPIVFDKVILEREADVENYVAALRNAYMAVISTGKVIAL